MGRECTYPVRSHFSRDDVDQPEPVRDELVELPQRLTNVSVGQRLDGLEVVLLRQSKQVRESKTRKERRM